MNDNRAAVANICIPHGMRPHSWQETLQSLMDEEEQDSPEVVKGDEYRCGKEGVQRSIMVGHWREDEAKRTRHQSGKPQSAYETAAPRNEDGVGDAPRDSTKSRPNRSRKRPTPNAP